MNNSIKDDITVINLDDVALPVVSNNLFDNRDQFANAFDSSMTTIMVIAYKNIEKTIQCLNSVLKNTEESSYRLLLIDSASEDGTCEYFQSIDHPHKKIIRLTKNCRGISVFRWGLNYIDTRYIVFLANDMIVSKNWLKKLRACIESDKKIGFAAPIMSNTNNSFRFDLATLNEHSIRFLSEKFSDSIPAAWEERTRIAAPAWIARREVLDVVGTMDYGYFHDFGEDDLEMRIRAAGYKVILAGDTYLHHNHYFPERDLSVDLPAAEHGAANYYNKYHGIHPWLDMDNYIFPYLTKAAPPLDNVEKPVILGLDTKCGQPLLDIKNFYHEHDINDIEIHCITTDPKYLLPLKYITENVRYSEADKIYTDFHDAAFDVILWPEPLNNYSNGLDTLNRLLRLLKKGGMMLLSLDNLYDINTVLAVFQNSNRNAGRNGTFLHLQDILDCLGRNNISQVNNYNENYYMPKQIEDQVQHICNAMELLVTDKAEVFKRLKIRKYWLTFLK